MSTVDSLKRIIRDALHLGDRANSLTASSPLMGAIAEFDSMAVVTVLTMIEDEFGFSISEDEVSAEFIAGSRGRLLAVVRRPSAAACNAVLIVPPFAEEMNKSRHLFTEIADALIESGVATVVVDLFGTGDSEGEFSDADWTVWKSDLAAAVQWARSQQITITKLLAVRLGCALGCEAARDNGWKLERSLLWQPVVSGTRA